MNWHLQLPKPSLAAWAAVICRLAFAAGAFTMLFPAAALAWQRQDLKDPFSGSAYSRLTQPAAGNFAVTGIAAGVPQLGLECDIGDNGRRSLSADISFPVAIDRESFVQLQYQFDGNRPVTELGRLLRPWHRLDFTDHSFAFIQPMLTASQVRMQFLLRGRGSPVLTFDLSDHAAVRSFVTACYPDVALVPPHVAPRVAEFLLQEGPAGITGLQTALHDLKLYSGALDGKRSPDLFLALQRYAVEHRADEVADDDLAHLTARTLPHILADDPAIAPEIRKQL